VIAFTGFRPTPEDTAGLSVYREKLVSPAQVAAGGRKPGAYNVARLRVGSLHQLGLSVVVDEQVEGPAGHALIPELSVDACRRNKMQLRAVQVRLAEWRPRTSFMFRSRDQAGRQGRRWNRPSLGAS
jgi:hypothetical protein